MTGERSAQLGSPGAFGDGLMSLLSGEDSFEAEAAASILAETVLLHRLWLRAHLEKK